MSDQQPRPYPTTVEEILAGIGLTNSPPIHQAPHPSAALVLPQPGGTPAVITHADYPYPVPAGYAPPSYYLPMPTHPQHFTPQQPAPAPHVSPLADAPLWVRAAILLAALGVAAAGVGIGIGQAAPGFDAGARFLMALAACGGVGLVGFLLLGKGGRQQQGGGVTNVTTHVTANVSATSVGRQRNRYR